MHRSYQEASCSRLLLPDNKKDTSDPKKKDTSDPKKKDTGDPPSRGAHARKCMLRPQGCLQQGGSGLQWWHAARLGPEQDGVRPQRP